jgi:hypothetical protein
LDTLPIYKPSRRSYHHEEHHLEDVYRVTIFDYSCAEVVVKCTKHDLAIATMDEE